MIHEAGDTVAENDGTTGATLFEIDLCAVEAFKGAVSICVCYDPPAEPTEATLANAAKLTARVCKRYHFPGRHIEPSQRRQWYERGWKRNGGIVFDLPDVFPIKNFLELVQDELALL